MSNGPVFEAGPGWGARIGSWLKSNMIYLLPGLAVIVLIIIIASVNGNGEPTLVEVSPSSSISASPAGSLSEIVVTRDSYTTVARRLIKKSGVSATPAMALYAETVLQSELRSQPLTVGQSISASSARISEILAGYAKLYPSQKAKWEAMAKNIKF